MTPGELEYRVHISAAAVEMDRDDRLCARGYFAFYVFRVAVEAGLEYINEYRPRAGSRDASRGGKEGEAWADHFVTRSYAQRHERDQERIGAGGDSDGMLDAAVARAFLLESLDLRSENEIAALEDPGKGVLQFRLELRVESF